MQIVDPDTSAEEIMAQIFKRHGFIPSDILGIVHGYQRRGGPVGIIYDEEKYRDAPVLFGLFTRRVRLPRRFLGVYHFDEATLTVNSNEFREDAIALSEDIEEGLGVDVTVKFVDGKRTHELRYSDLSDGGYWRSAM